MDHSAMTSADVTFQTIRIAVACKLLHASFITVRPIFPYQYYYIFQQIWVNRNRNMLIGGWTTCEPSCEDVHNSLSPPGTLYFHGPASDVNAPAVLWIVRTDYSVGGRGLEVSAVCVCCVWCVCVYIDARIFLRVCDLFMFVCTCMWSVNVSLTSGVCVCQCVKVQCAKSLESEMYLSGWGL